MIRRRVRCGGCAGRVEPLVVAVSFLSVVEAFTNGLIRGVPVSETQLSSR
jgi:hypothetical protein